MDIIEVKAKIKEWYLLNLKRIDRVELIKANANNGDLEELLSYNDNLENEKTTKGMNLEEYHLKDAGNAEYFTDQYGDKLRFDHRRRRWLEWHKHCWRPESDGVVMRLALLSFRAKYKAAVDVEDREKRIEISNFAINSEARARLEACIAIAQNLKPIADSGEAWNADPWLFCVDNGVIDLRAGELRPGKPEDMITLKSPVIYDKDAKAPRWLKYLDEVFIGDTELINWLQLFLGYCLTGDTREQVFAIGHGNGANGKTKLLEILRYIMGDYAYDAPFSTFELTQRPSIPNDLAALANRRLVTSSETNQGTRLNEARIKALAGQDSITARFLNAEFFTYHPVAKFFLAVNYLPRVQDDSYGFWRKVRRIPFDREFKGENADKLLLEKLKVESSGILNWLLEGCLEWQQRGLDPAPARVLRATEEYKADSDPLSEFLLDQCAFTEQAQSRATGIYKAYLNWCEDQGMRERERMTLNAFGRRMGQKFQKTHDRAGAFYQGVGLKCDGFVTDFKATDKNCELASISLYPRETELGNTSQSVTSYEKPSPIPSQVNKVTRDNEIPQSPLMEGENRTLNGKTQSLATLVPDEQGDIPEYPHQKCRCGSGDFWLNKSNKWVCSSCHPKPKSEDNENNV